MSRRSGILNVTHEVITLITHVKKERINKIKINFAMSIKLGVQQSDSHIQKKKRATFKQSESR